jgi:hypothetical protein
MTKLKRPSSEEAVESLQREDWDFSGLPDGELVGCCYWEYARESAFIRETLHRYREWAAEGGKRDKASDELFARTDQIQSIGYPAAVFMAGCGFRPGRTSQSEDPARSNYRHPDAPPISGSFPAPWQSLTEAERKYRAHIGNDIEQLDIVPIKLAHWSWGKDIARVCQMLADRQHEQRKTWERGSSRRDDKGNLFTLPELAEIRPGLRWGFGETLLVDIAWRCFTNDEIANYFRRWVKHNRPREIPVPSNKGRKPGDLRAQLTRLAVMRLLSRFKPSDILIHRDDDGRAIWETKQFAGRKWFDATKWHDARREAGQFFRRLFPFLPVAEKPLSWERRPPGK